MTDRGHADPQIISCRPRVYTCFILVVLKEQARRLQAKVVADAWVWESVDVATPLLKQCLASRGYRHQTRWRAALVEFETWRAAHPGRNPAAMQVGGAAAGNGGIVRR